MNLVSPTMNRGPLIVLHTSPDSVAMMSLLGLVLYFCLLTSASKLLQEKEYHRIVDEMSDDEVLEIWDAMQEAKNHQNLGTINITIAFNSENILSSGIFKEPDDMDHIFESTFKIKTLDTVIVAAEAYQLCKVKSGEVAIAYTLSMTLNPHVVTVYQLLFVLNAYLRPYQTKYSRQKKVLVTTFQNGHTSKHGRNPKNSDTLFKAGMVEGSIVTVESISQELKKVAGWSLEVEKRKKAVNTIIMGKPRSPHDFPENSAVRCTFEDEKDNIHKYLDIKDDRIKDEKNYTPNNINVDQTEDFISKVIKEGMIFILITILWKIVLNYSLKHIKNYYAEDCNIVKDDKKAKKKNKCKTKSKKAVKALEKEGNVILKKDSKVREGGEISVEHICVQKSSSNLETSLSTKCLKCKKAGGKDDPLKKCRGCR